MRRRSRFIHRACLVTGFLPVAAQCEPVSLWNHNGSVMALYVTGDEHEMRYQEPRTGMRQEGVVAGTVRFKGTLSGGTYTGTAFVFSRRCGGAHPYPVTGTLSADRREITLKGTAPAGFDTSCRLSASRKDVVQFNFLRTVEPAAPAPEQPDRSAEETAAAGKGTPAEEARAVQDREEQQRQTQELQARQLREQQERAERARREREQAEQALAAERAIADARRLADQREGCAKYRIASCDAALASPHASLQDAADLRERRGIAEKLLHDIDKCKAGSVASCNEALVSPAASAEQRQLTEQWRIAASPINRLIVFLSSQATALANAVAKATRTIGNWVDLSRIAGGIAIVFGLTLAVTTLRRPDENAPAPATSRVRAVAMYRTRKAMRWLRHLRPALAQWRTTPSDQPSTGVRDTAGAIEALEIAHAYIEAVREAETPTGEDHALRKQQLDMLAFASKQIAIAQGRDPAAILEGEDREGTYRFSANELRAEAHLLEGITLHPHDVDGAIRALRRATSLNPKNSYPFYVLGVIYATGMKRHKAVAALKHALTLQPQNLAYRKELDRALNLAGGKVGAFIASHGIDRIREAGNKGARAVRRFARRRYLSLYGRVLRPPSAAASRAPVRRSRPSRHLTQVEGKGEIGVHASGFGRRSRG